MALLEDQHEHAVGGADREQVREATQHETRAREQHDCEGDLGEWCHWGATTQDITDTATTLKYIIIQPRTAKDMIDQIGGQEGESALLLTANPTHLQAMLAGKPLGPGPLGTFPLIAGTWHADVSANGKMPETHVVLEITVDGRYRAHRVDIHHPAWVLYRAEADIDVAVLERMVGHSWRLAHEKFGPNPRST